MGKGEFLFLLQGLKWTLVLAAVAFIGGMVSGLGVALARTSGEPLLFKGDDFAKTDVGRVI